MLTDDVAGAQDIIGGASAVSAATARSSKSRFAIDICLVRANHTEHARKKGHRHGDDL